MLKKKLALFFAASMVVASVAGCGGGDSQQADAPAADAAADAAADDAAADDAADDTADDAADDTADDAADDTADDAADASAASGELITVGIINNDPSESGYRTANDRDLKEHFTDENVYCESFA